MMHDEIVVGLDLLRSEEAFFLLGAVFMLLDTPEDSCDGPVVGGCAGDDYDLIIGLYSMKFLGEEFYLSVGFEMMLISLVLFLSEVNSMCFIYPGLCLCTHVVILLSVSSGLCLSILSSFFLGGLVEFLSSLCPAHSPEFCFVLLSWTELFSLVSRFFTLSLRMSMNLLVGHVLVYGAWLFVCHSYGSVLGVLGNKCLVSFKTVGSHWFILGVWVFFEGVCSVYSYLVSIVSRGFEAVMGGEGGFSLFQVVIFSGLLLMYEREACVYVAMRLGLWVNCLCPRYWASFWSKSYMRAVSDWSERIYTYTFTPVEPWSSANLSYELFIIGGRDSKGKSTEEPAEAVSWEEWGRRFAALVEEKPPRHKKGSRKSRKNKRSGGKIKKKG